LLKMSQIMEGPKCSMVQRQMASSLSHVQALLPGTCRLKLDSVIEQDGYQVLIAASSSVAYCPTCHNASRSLHSQSLRVLRDLPWEGSTVELRLDVRRVRCRTWDCPRVTFAELRPLFLRATVAKHADCPKRFA
jgi:transposase